jgi:hypothetical protein
VLDGIRRKV